MEGEEKELETKFDAKVAPSIKTNLNYHLFLYIQIGLFTLWHTSDVSIMFIYNYTDICSYTRMTMTNVYAHIRECFLILLLCKTQT
jgi:hypothetical protein